jgi:hypothetical protein
MTELGELIAVFEKSGGTLKLDGGQISYACPDELEDLLGLLTEVKSEVKARLRRRQEAVARWIRDFCIGCLAARSDPRVLYREYVRWAIAGPVPYEQFIEALAVRGHTVGSDGMVIDLVPAQDFLAQTREEARRAGEADAGKGEAITRFLEWPCPVHGRHIDWWIRPFFGGGEMVCGKCHPG